MTPSEAAAAVKEGRVLTDRIQAVTTDGTARAYVHRLADLNRVRPDLVEAVATGAMKLDAAELVACAAGVLAIAAPNCGGNYHTHPYTVRRGDEYFGDYCICAVAWAQARYLNRKAAEEAAQGKPPAGEIFS